jgi:hypothetical protein
MSCTLRVLRNYLIRKDLLDSYIQVKVPPEEKRSYQPLEIPHGGLEDLGSYSPKL